MHFIDRDGFAQQVALAASLHPILIAPGVVVEAPYNRRGARRRFCEEGVRVRFLLHLAATRYDEILVVLARPQRWDEQFPNAAVAMLHGMAGAVPSVELAEYRDFGGLRRPDSEENAFEAVFV